MPSRSTPWIASNVGAPAVLLQSRAHAAAVPIRALHGWHLLSLDAATVAFCWMLLFARAAHESHALAEAGALAGAVWLVYAADRLLDARREWAASSSPVRLSALSRLYVERRREFLRAGAGVAAGVVWLLWVLPRALAEAWLLLAVPLALYATVVHGLHLHARWKAVSVGIFFASAVALPAAVRGGCGWPLVGAALAFGGVCRANCAVLRAPARRVRLVLLLGTAVSLPPLWFAETRTIALACLSALGLLVVLVRERDAVCDRMGALTWRALVDAALVAPVLVFGALHLFVRSV